MLSQAGSSEDMQMRTFRQYLKLFYVTDCHSHCPTNGIKKYRNGKSKV